MIKIKRFLTTAVLAMSLIPLAVVTFFSAYALLGDVEKRYKESLYSSVKLEQKTLSLFVAMQKQTAFLFSDFNTIRGVCVSKDSALKTAVTDSFNASVSILNYVDSFMIIDREGLILVSTRPELVNKKIPHDFFVNNCSRGVQVVTKIAKDKYISDGKPVFSIVTPIFIGTDHVGSLAGNYNLGFFTQTKKNADSLVKNSFLLMDNEHTIVFNDRDDPEIAKGFLNSYLTDGNDALTENFFTFTVGSEPHAAYYVPVPETDWVLCSYVPQSDFYKTRNLIALAIALLFIMIVVASLFLQRKFTAMLMQPLENMMVFIGRVTKGDYSVRMETSRFEEYNNVAQHFNFLVSTIQQNTEVLERQKNDLYQSNERYRIISDFTKEIIFEWNFTTDTAEYSYTWWKYFGYDPITKNVYQSFLAIDTIHPDDKNVFFAWAKRVHKGRSNDQEEYRIKTSAGDYSWVRVKTIPIFDNENNPIKAVGLIQDIQETKRKETELLRRAEHDALTNLFNRRAFEQRVEQLIKLNSPFALLFVDIDDFRFFNTKFGHAFGDRVINFIGSVLLEATESSGFAGRVGGDEFIVCVSATPVLRDIDSYAEQLIETLKRGFRCRETDGAASINCSIGVVFFPETAATYEELTLIADKAMYKVKDSGKGNFIVVKNRDLN